MSNQGWSDYRLEAFGEPYMVWHDGPSFYQFQQNAREDPVTAERVLLEGLAQNDPLAAQAIAEGNLPADMQQRFLPVLTEAIDRTNDTFRVSVAQALFRITADQSWATAIVTVLLGGAFWSDRLDAAMALRYFTPTVELIAALMQGMQDPEYLVRYHSANSLLRFGGEEKDIADDQELFALVRSEDSPDKWMLAASGLAGAASARMTLAGGEAV